MTKNKGDRKRECDEKSSFMLFFSTFSSSKGKIMITFAVQIRNHQKVMELASKYSPQDVESK